MGIALHIVMVLIDSSPVLFVVQLFLHVLFYPFGFLSADYSISRSKLAIRNISAPISLSLVKRTLRILSVLYRGQCIRFQGTFIGVTEI